MSFSETLKIIITADAAGAERSIKALSQSTGGLAASGKQAQGLAASADKIGTSMIRAGAATTLAAAGMAAGIYKAAESAQSLADSVDKAQAVFGKSATSGLDRFATSAADSMGKSKAAALDAASAYGLLLKQQGIGGKALADQSSALATRTADLAEQYKKPYEEVQAAIEKVLRTGSGKSLKGLLGVNIDIDPKKLEGLSTAARTAEELKQILDQTAGSAGFFAKSQDDIGVSIQKTQAKWENAKAAFGKASLPALSALAESATGLLNAFNNLPEGVKSAAGEVAVFGTIAAGVIGPVTTIGGAALKGIGALSKMGAAGAEAATGVEAAGAAAATAGASIASTAGLIGAGTVAIAAWGLAWEEASRKAKQAADDQAYSVKDLLKNTKPGTASNQLQNQELASILAGQRKSDQGGFSRILDNYGGSPGSPAGLSIGANIGKLFGLGGAQDDIDYVNRTFETLKATIASLAPADAKANIADLKTRLEALNVPASDVTRIITILQQEITDTGNAGSAAAGGIDAAGTAIADTASAADAAKSAMLSYTDQLMAAADAGQTFADKFTAISQKLNQPADTASAAISAGLDLQEAKLRLAELDSGSKTTGTDAADVAARVADANDAVAAALIRRRKAQEDLDKLTQRSVIAGSVPLIQQINKAADEAVKAAEGAAAQAKMKFGAGSKEDVAAEANVQAARARRGDAAGLLDKALAEQGGKNATAVRDAKDAVAAADRDVAKALKDRTRATQESTGSTKSATQAEIDRKRAELGVADAQRRLQDAEAKVAGAAQDGEDPLNRLRDSLVTAGVSASDADGLIKGLNGSMQEFAPTLSLIMGILNKAPGGLAWTISTLANVGSGGAPSGPMAPGGFGGYGGSAPATSGAGGSGGRPGGAPSSPGGAGGARITNPDGSLVFGAFGSPTFAGHTVGEIQTTNNYRWKWNGTSWTLWDPMPVSGGSARAGTGGAAPQPAKPKPSGKPTRKGYYGGEVVTQADGSQYQWLGGVWYLVTAARPAADPRTRTPFASGGMVPGVGTGDTVPAMLTPGEFVVTKAATQAIGTETLRALNKGNVARFSSGGLVRATTGTAGAGDISSSAGSWTRGVEVKPVFHITTTESPRVVANEVVRRMRRSTFLAGVR